MGEKLIIHANHSILINRPAEAVWDFTQDFSIRTTWDRSLQDCTLIASVPERKASILAKGGLSAVLEYKLFDRPHKTSVRMTHIHSPLIVDGGGSWTYEKQSAHSTLWSQSNTLTMKNSWLSILLKPLLNKVLKMHTVKTMKRAKLLLEQ